MKARRVLYIGAPIALVCVYAYLDLAEIICNLPRSDAEVLIHRDLEAKGLDSSHLSPIEYDWPQSCSYSATFKSPTEHISLVVMQDLLHGTELHTWDFNRK